MSATDLMALPLSGVNLIEASAGTGKTYTISALILRLLVERGCPVGSILVVTFSEAAAADLRHQVRERIRRAHAFFLDPGSDQGDDFLPRLAEKVADRDGARRRLAAALREFDEAAIHTIHGFCLRALQEESLAGRLLFDADLDPDATTLVRQAACDFFRRNLAVKGPELAVLVGDAFLPDRLAGLAAAVPAGVARVEPRPDPDDEKRFIARVGEVSDLLDELAGRWPRWRDEVADALAAAIGEGRLNRRSYREEAVADWLTTVDGAVAGGLPAFLRASGLPQQLCLETLEARVNKGKTPPGHPFFALASRLNRAHAAALELRDRLRVAYAVRFVREAGAEVERARRQRGSLGFDDLLVILERALGRDPHLAVSLRRRYPYAFIDEFQDTDYLQFAIFRAIYGQDGDSLLYLIGDPKQSIYGFRGADLRVYLAARRLVAGRETSLDRNYRSTPAMVRAVNRVFTFHPRPFLLEGMGDLPAVESADRVAGLEVEGDSAAALRIVLCHRPAEVADSGRPLDQARSEALVCDWLADEIVRLLSLGDRGRARIGERRLSAGDIAVLVRNNPHAHLVQRRLARAGVASVLFSGESVFASREAADLMVLLAAVAAPADAGLIRAALLTPFLGLSAGDLAGLEDDGGWDLWLERFRRWRDIWQGHGVLRMLRVLARECGLRTRLAAMSMGERRLTNFFHLAEILEERSGRGRAGIRDCLALLAAGPGSGRDDASQLRLESDADCVQIITMHKSKGLQFPVVFCPFLWYARGPERGARDAPPRPVLFHAGDDSPPGVDFGSAEYDSRVAGAREEDLAETIRLAYVALTRAVHRCYVAWGVLGNNPGMTSLAYLFHRQVSKRWPGVGRGLLAAIGERGILADLERLAGDSGDIGVFHYHGGGAGPGGGRPRPAPGSLEVLDFSGPLPEPWRDTSFSAIVRSGEDRDHHDAGGGCGDGDDGPALDGFPRGARAGLFFHAVLEEVDFSDSSGWADTVTRLLNAYGFPGDWAGAVLDMLARLFDMPLGPGGERLALVRRDRRLSELGFVFPCAFSPVELAGFFSAADRGWSADFSRRLARLPGERLAGFMRGFIDLVFEQNGRYFIVDWKSNHLGCGPEAYGDDAVLAAMTGEAYILQYHIYAAALHRHLAARLPGYRYDRHFGGVFYPFLRGVANGADAVFRDRPDAGFLDRFSRLLGGGGIRD